MRIENLLKIIILLLGSVLCLSGCEKITSPLQMEVAPAETVSPLTVMTYNVYLGSSTDTVLGVEHLVEVPTAVAKVYDTFIASDFPGRAAVIAASIATHRPHLIGLQEMSLIRQQFPGDRILGGSLPAEEVVMDFRTVLIDALTAAGEDYRIVAEVENIDVEMPMFSDEGIVDVRLTDYDVILARSDVGITDVVYVNYTAAFGVEKLGLLVKRGYAAVDAMVEGVTYRFVNTHLESFNQEVRVAQTHELIEHLSEETFPIVLLGDFNTPAPNGTAYQILIGAGYIDTWQKDTIGNTCCQQEYLRNEVSEHTRRIDQIFVGNSTSEIRVLMTQTVGDTPSDRSASGVWSSDHSGVIAQLLF